MPLSADEPTASTPATPGSLVDLVGRACEGDEAAFNRLIEMYYSPIREYLTRMTGDDNIGQDLAQDTFITAWCYLARQLKDKSLFRAWLYKIATNKARDFLRRKKKICWEVIEETVIPESMRTVDPQELVGEVELIRQALAQVAPQYRSCLILHFITGLSKHEIAQSLQIKESSVSKYIQRGVCAFKCALVNLQNEQLSLE